MAPNCLPHQVKSEEKKEEIDWRIQNWAVDAEAAAAYSLIQSYCAQPLARALSEDSGVYAASTHLICSLLATVAHRTSEPAPKTWVNLTGAIASARGAPHASAHYGASPHR